VYPVTCNFDRKNCICVALARWDAHLDQYLALPDRDRVEMHSLMLKKILVPAPTSFLIDRIQGVLPKCVPCLMEVVVELAFCLFV